MTTWKLSNWDQTLVDWLLEQITEDERLATLAGAWDPARTVAECATKRRIIAWATGDGDYDLANAVALIEGEWNSSPGLPDQLLALLALPYANRPGYREEWRP